MATNFSEVYERAIFKVSDFGFLDNDTNSREAILEKFLTSAQVDFQDVCIVDLSDRDMVNKQYNNDLDDEIQEILALGVAYYWLSAKTLRSDLLKNIMYSKDYTTYSPANLLKEVKALRDSLKSEFRGRINSYSLKHADLSTWSA